MEDNRLPGKAGNQNRDLTVQVPEPTQLCSRVCTTPLLQLTRTTVVKLRVGEPANGFYLLLRTLEPTITGAIDFEFGPNLLVMVEDHDKNHIHFCLHAHVHLKFEPELRDLLPVNTVFVLKEPTLLTSPEKLLAVVVGSPSDFVLVCRSHFLYKDAEALSWRPKLEHDGTDDSALLWKVKGDTLFEKGELDEALDVYLFSQTIGGDNETNLITNQKLAQVFFKSGYYERAIKHCHKVLESMPTNEESLYRAGLAHYELRQFTEAKFYFEMLRTVSPSNGEAELVRCEERLKEAEGNVDILKLFGASQTEATTPIDHGNFAKNVEFRVRPNNQRCVYATQNLGPGALILVEKPIVVVFEPHSPSERGRIDFMRTAFKAILKNPKSVGRKLYGLPGADTPTEENKKLFCDEVNELEPILDKESLYQPIRRNLLEPKICIMHNDSYSYRVYELASRFRHRCLSNCAVVYYKDVITIRVCTSVLKGEELFVQFCENNVSLREKQMLFARIGLACSCYLCHLDQIIPTELHALREELKAKFDTQLNLYGSVPVAAEVNLLPIVQELEQTYSYTKSLRPILFLVYCDLAYVVDRSREDWTRRVTFYVAAGLASANMSIEFLFCCADGVIPKIPQWTLMPGVLFHYAAMMAEVESWNGRPDLVAKWINVLLVLERVFTGGTVEMLMQRFPRAAVVQSLLSAHVQSAAHPLHA